MFTSRHEPWKKFDWAVEVVSMVVKKHPDTRLVIPGAETTITPRLKMLARRLKISDKVVFTGAISQKSLWRLYQNAYLYIFTSPKEDLGIVVQEAQAAGVPVVAWKAGGPTVTVLDKMTGYLIEPYSLKKMVDSILYLLKEPLVRNKMGHAAWQHVKRKFSWDKHVDIMEKEFNKALDRK